MKISRQHALGRDEAKARVERMAGELEQRFGLSSEWNDNRLNIRGSGVQGHLLVSDNSVDLDIDLGFSLKLMESSIRTAVKQQMDKHLV